MSEANDIVRPWAKLHQRLGDEPTKAEAYGQLLAGISGAQTDRNAERLAMLLRGQALIKNAREWEEPQVGAGGGSRARGAQWQLVLGYSGLEMIGRSIFELAPPPNARPRTWQCVDWTLERALEHLPARPDALPNDTPVASNARPRLLDETMTLGRFLSMDEHGKEPLERWQNGGLEPTWAERIGLARAMRHATVHGALSANKIIQLGIQASLEQLTLDVVAVADGVANALVTATG